MANIQYIGARYVPIVFKNPDDGSAAWKSGVSYENLVIVTYLDDSYTSRKPVPASVGNPASNPDYWAKTGDFNAALSTLQNEISLIDNRLSLFDKRKFIFIGDSYADPAYMNWVNKIVAILGLSSSDYYNGAINGTGFLKRSNGTSGNGFLLDCLRQFDNVITDKDEITDIIVIGGANDILTAQTDDLNVPITDFANYAAATYPNARVGVGFIARFLPNDRDWAKYTTSKVVYHSVSRLKNCYYLNGIENSMHAATNQLVDLVHPNSACGILMTRCLHNCLVTGYGDFAYRNAYIDNGVGLELRCANDMAKLTIYSLPTPALGDTIGGFGVYGHLTYKIATLSSLYFHKPIYAKIGVYNQGKLYNGHLRFKGYDIYLTVDNFDTTVMASDITVGSDFAWNFGDEVCCIEFNSDIIA